MNISPEQLARSGSEHGHQAALFCFFAINAAKYPTTRWLFHIQNASANRGAAAVGVKSGVPDICLPIKRAQFSGLYIELKRPDSVGKKSGKTSNEQDEWLMHLLSEGYSCMVCYGWEDARDTIIAYLEQK